MAAPGGLTGRARWGAAKPRGPAFAPPPGGHPHEVRLGPFDVVSLGGLMVSSPLRTALDIALHVNAETAVPALRLLLAKPELDVRLRLLVLAVEAMPRLPHKNAALEKLALLAPPAVARGAVDVEDPVDPPHSTEHVAKVLRIPHLEGKL